MAKLYNTPNLDELEKGPWPSFVTGMKKLASDDHEGASMVRDVLATLETSYVTKKGYWKGGTVGVIGYGGGVIPHDIPVRTAGPAPPMSKPISLSSLKIV